MEQIKSMLIARKNYLLQLKKEKQTALVSVPEGTLRICSHGNRVQFYHRTDPKDFNGTYIREKDARLVKKLAQKDYDQKVLRAIEKEIGAIDKCLEISPKKGAEQIFGTLHSERQKLVVPIRETDESFVRQWEQIQFKGKEFYEDIPEFYTARGERVRSKSEVIIADMLYREGIPYRYEYPVQLKGIGMIYPDFTVLNIRERKEVYWEHLGMMDDSVYAEKAVQKIVTYEQNGIFPGEDLVLTYETKKNPINQKMIMEMIKRFLQ